jgi:drug/metabolite transporter (DMT)-like permease
MQGKNEGKAVILIILCTAFTSAAQLLWKSGIGSIDFTVWVTVLNLPFILGFVSYGFGAILMLSAFRWGELSLLYPILATSYVWVSLISPVLFPDDGMNIWKWLGVLMIISAVSLLGYGSAKSEGMPEVIKEVTSEGDNLV